MVDVKIPWEVLLSVCIVVGGCEWTNYINVVLMGTATLILWYIHIVSASAAEDIIFLTVQHSVSIGPLGFGAGFEFPVVILLLK